MKELSEMSAIEIFGMLNVLENYIKENPGLKKEVPVGARSFDVQVHLAGVLTRKPSTNKPLPGLDSGFNNRLILRLLDLHQKHLKSQSKKLHIDKIIDEAKAIDLKNHDLKNKLDTAKKEHIKTLPTRPPKDGGITASILSNN